MDQIRTADLFSGVGGSSWGAHLAGARLVAAFDSWELAGKVYQDNFPTAWFQNARLEDIDPRALKKDVGRIDLITASPECTNHSPAKGNRPRCEQSKATAFQVIRFAKAFEPRWIVIENVTSMRNWSRYGEFLNGIESLGYSVKSQVLTATDFGVPQSRRRLFILCDREKEPPTIVPRKTDCGTAANVVDSNGTHAYSPLICDRRAKATLDRADRAIEQLGHKRPFLLVYYGSDHAGGWQRLDAPLRTVTTLDRFAFVRPTENGHEMRMLQVPELRRAMGMPARMRLRYGTRRDQIKMMGNAVCPPVMTAAICSLVANKGNGAA